MKQLLYIFLLAMLLVLLSCTSGNRKNPATVTVSEIDYYLIDSVALWDSTQNKVTVALIQRLLTSEDRDRIIKRKSIRAGISDRVPYIELSFLFKPQSKKFLPQDLQQLQVHFQNFGSMPVTFNYASPVDWSRQGVLLLQGDPEDKGVFEINLKHNASFAIEEYKWDISLKTRLERIR